MEAAQTYEQQLINRYAAAKFNLKARSKPTITFREVVPIIEPEAPVELLPTLVGRDFIVLSPLVPGADHDALEAFNRDGLPVWKKIILEVAEKHGVSFSDICSDRRDYATVAARHEAAFELHAKTSMTYYAIGKRLGGKDHTTVINAVKKHRQRLEKFNALLLEGELSV